MNERTRSRFNLWRLRDSKYCFHDTRNTGAWLGNINCFQTALFLDQQSWSSAVVSRPLSSAISRTLDGTTLPQVAPALNCNHSHATCRRPSLGESLCHTAGAHGTFEAAAIAVSWRGPRIGGGAAHSWSSGNQKRKRAGTWQIDRWWTSWINEWRKNEI